MEKIGSVYCTFKSVFMPMFKTSLMVLHSDISGKDLIILRKKYYINISVREHSLFTKYPICIQFYIENTLSNEASLYFLARKQKIKILNL